jgi:hypothetical protein
MTIDAAILSLVSSLQDLKFKEVPRRDRAYFEVKFVLLAALTQIGKIRDAISRTDFQNPLILHKEQRELATKLHQMGVRAPRRLSQTDSDKLRKAPRSPRPSGAFFRTFRRLPRFPCQAGARRRRRSDVRSSFISSVSRHPRWRRDDLSLIEPGISLHHF